MKYLLAFLVLMSSPAFAETKCEAQRAVTTINGLVCDFCAQGVKKVLMKESAVEAVDFDLTTKHVVIDMKSDQDLSDAQLKTLIDSTGFELAKVERVCKPKP